MPKKEIIAALDGIEKKLKALKEGLKKEKAPYDVRRSQALALDKAIKKFNEEQDKATTEGVNVNDAMMKCVKLAKKCWPHLADVDIPWSETTKTTTKSWKTTPDDDGPENPKTATIAGDNHPELQQGEVPYDSKPADETTYNQADHWKLFVVQRLARAVKEMAKNKWAGKVSLNPNLPSSVWDSVEVFHKQVFQLQTQNPQQFNDYVKADGKHSKLVRECIGKAMSLANDENKKLQLGQGSQLLVAAADDPNDPDFISANEHWQHAFLPLLVALVNKTLSKGTNADIMVATGGTGAAQMIEEFFQPLREEHRKAFTTGNLAKQPSFKLTDMPTELKGLLGKAQLQLEGAIIGVLKSKTSSKYFLYAPIG